MKRSELKVHKLGKNRSRPLNFRRICFFCVTLIRIT